MRQDELDEISLEFIEAWTDYFGDEMYYVIFTGAVVHPLYKESKNKTYDYFNKRLFHGTLKESPVMDEARQSGQRINKNFEITLITKELVDQEILYINVNDIIMYIDRFGKENLYKIYDEYQKVQLSSNKIFTKIRVIPYG